MKIDTKKKYTARLKTSKGDIVAALYADKVPNTVNNFVFLARDGFYDNTTFHRVIKPFMVQGGDPTGTGSGGPGYQFRDEFHSTLKHNSAGVLSMANSGPNTNGSQFFITHVPTPHLDNHHTVFGRVIEGIDVLNAIPERDPGRAKESGETLISVEITEE
jgi:cyclophilin family peptidyl-prolyl cis-trans isomerase